jgi:hypothetical protein
MALSTLASGARSGLAALPALGRALGRGFASAAGDDAFTVEVGWIWARWRPTGVLGLPPACAPAAARPSGRALGASATRCRRCGRGRGGARARGRRAAGRRAPRGASPPPRSQRAAQSAAARGAGGGRSRPRAAAPGRWAGRWASAAAAAARRWGSRQRPADAAPQHQVMPYKAHKIEPPSNVVETSIKELTSMCARAQARPGRGA